MDNYIEIPEKRYCSGIKMNLSRATPKSKSINILTKCSFRPLTIQEIYPNTKNPLAHEVVALTKTGFLKKLSKPKYILTYTSKNTGDICNKYRKVWYSTTYKGKAFVDKILDC